MRSKLAAFSVLLLVSVIASCSDSLTGTRQMRAANGSSFDEVNGDPAPRVRISQVYGAGGNSGATYNADFIELYNAGTAPQDLSGWSVQYASATGTGNLGANSSQLVTLSGTINPGQYYLVAMTAGANGVLLPTADRTGTIALAAGAGKVALADQTASLGCNSASTCASVASHIIDLVGYGNANYFEGLAAAPTIDATHSALRKDVCVDSDDNAADFQAAAPQPRNSSTTSAVCSGDNTPAGPLDHLVLNGAGSVAVGDSLILSAQLLDAANHVITDPAATYEWMLNDESVAEIHTLADGRAVVKGLMEGEVLAIASVTSHDVNVAELANITVTPADTAPAGGHSGTVTPTTVFASEIHYDNVGTDANEAIEIESPAGQSLDGYSLVLYDGANGHMYPDGSDPMPLAGLAQSICQNGRQVAVIHFPVNGLQNGSQDGVTPTVPDGWAIVNADGQVVEFASYEGTFVATNGPALGYTSTDIGKSESAQTSTSQSLQRAGNGVWYGPVTSTFGACNPDVPPAPQTIVIQDRPTALPVGFQDQFFISSGSVNSQGAAVGNADVVWSSSAPSIVSVDPASGVVTAHAAGQATITATAKNDVAFGTAVVTAAVAATSSSARVGHNTEFGVPSDGNPNDELIISRRQYTLSYNPARGGPNWVSWNLDASHKGSSPRCDCFSADPEVAAAGYPAYDTNDWINGGEWSRGHMSPSADWNVSDGDNAPTFYLSNMLPQNQTLNSGAWGDLENHLRDLATGSAEVYVIAGGIFTHARTNGVDGLGYMNSKGHILVPDSVWKIAVVVPDARAGSSVTNPADVQVIAAKFPNSAAGTGSYMNYLSTIDAIQRSTGYDFLGILPENVQCRLESRNCAPTADFSGPVSGNEGQTLSFNGSASSDPDGGQLNYQWSINGTSVGTGATLDFEFEQNGEYDVTLVVSDAQGASSTKVSTISIANVPPSVGSFAGASISVGSTYTSTGIFTDPGADDWTGTVDYGDGSGAQPLTLGNGAFTLNHKYASAGSFTVTVKISDGLAIGSSTATVTVAAAASHVPVARITGPANGLEGQPLSFDASTSSDPDGDRLTYRWTVNNANLTAAIGPRLTYIFNDNGSYHVTLTATDRTGRSASTTQAVVISNVAPSVTFRASGKTTIEAGDRVNVSGSFFDPGKDSPWTSQIAWGDDHNTVTRAATERSANDRISDSFEYDAPGTYTAKLTVTDKDHASGSATITFTVVPRRISGNGPGPIHLGPGNDFLKFWFSHSMFHDFDDVDCNSIRIGNVPVGKKNGKFQYTVQRNTGRVELNFDRQALIKAGVLTSNSRQVTITGRLKNGMRFESVIPISTIR